MPLDMRANSGPTVRSSSSLKMLSFREFPSKINISAGRKFMQVQAFEGYWENGQFYPLGQMASKTGKLRAILTVLNEPVRDINTAPGEPYTEWLNRLNEAIALSADEDLPDIPRSKAMRSPINFC